MYYLIKETIEKSKLKECLKGSTPYVAVLSGKEWEEQKESFSMGIDLDIPMGVDVTKAEINFDSLTGSFSIPDRKDICGENIKFSFALDEKGVVFIDESGYTKKSIEEIQKVKKWRLPSLERFLYDFIENIVLDDLKMLEDYDSRLEKMEDDILAQKGVKVVETLNDIRGELIELRMHYEQLIDLSQELEENENNFFDAKNLRYFKLLTNRLERYRDRVLALRDYCIQIRDLYQTQIDIKQNKTMAVLTVVTTIFFPLSIITGWYGMNFVYMPELNQPYAYPIVIGVCILIVLGGIIISKVNKWF